MNYDFYVWACYAIAAVVLGGIAAASFYDLLKQKKLLNHYRDKMK